MKEYECAILLVFVIDSRWDEVMLKNGKGTQSVVASQYWGKLRALIEWLNSSWRAAVGATRTNICQRAVERPKSPPDGFMHGVVHTIDVGYRRGQELVAAGEARNASRKTIIPYRTTEVTPSEE